jgi:hypothetical protein
LVDINSAEFSYKFKICGGDSFYCECDRVKEKNNQAREDMAAQLENNSALSSSIVQDTFTESDVFED